MNSDIDHLLDQVDEWKFKLHDKLKNLTGEEEAAFWKRSAAVARKMGLHVVEPGKRAKRPGKRVRRRG